MKSVLIFKQALSLPLNQDPYTGPPRLSALCVLHLLRKWVFSLWLLSLWLLSLWWVLLLELNTQVDGSIGVVEIKVGLVSVLSHQVRLAGRRMYQGYRSSSCKC